MYGNNILKSGLGRITESTPQYQGVIIYSMSDLPLVSSAHVVDILSYIRYNKLPSNMCMFTCYCVSYPQNLQFVYGVSVLSFVNPKLKIVFLLEHS